jgi:hypothetical protein
MDGSGERDRDVAGTATCSTQSRCTVKTRQGEVCQRLDRRFRMRRDVGPRCRPDPTRAAARRHRSVDLSRRGYRGGPAAVTAFMHGLGGRGVARSTGRGISPESREPRLRILTENTNGAEPHQRVHPGGNPAAHGTGSSRMVDGRRRRTTFASSRSGMGGGLPWQYSWRTRCRRRCTRARDRPEFPGDLRLLSRRGASVPHFLRAPVLDPVGAGRVMT